MRTAPSNVRFLGYSGREMLAVRLSHFDPSLPLAANFAVMHNAAFLIRTKASFVTPSTAKSLPSGSSKWLVMASAIPMKRVRERYGRVRLPAIAKLLNFSIALGSRRRADPRPLPATLAP
jgi:hypothetical protein